MGGCLSEDDVLRLVRGTFDAQELAHQHLDGCAGCRALVAEVALADGGPEAEGWSHLSPGATVGRYVVREALGAGAMGWVFAAQDPQLHRSVALKLLNGTAAEASGLRARLLREAQALARFSHPNVVAVHDVGEFGDQLFVALEHVDGGTLTEWLAERPRSAREKLAIFRQAGEGLAAAHAAGLVHRDFKPDNVLVGKDGRARVSDFGLAHEVSVPQEPRSATVERPLRLTASGALVGTPAYMAPEQLDGKPADERSDQFAFCVSLYEALAGVRPFAGNTVAELRHAQRQGRLQPPRLGLPSRARRVLGRGLSRNPEERFPSLHALLSELSGRRIVTVRSAALALGLVAAIGFAAWRARSFARCDGADAPWAPVWNDDRLGKLRDGLGPLATQPAVALIDRSFRDYQRTGAGMEVQACRAARAREDSPQLSLARLRCLAEHRLVAIALAHALTGRKATLEEAAAASGTLPLLEECQNTRQLLALPEPSDDPATRQRLDELSLTLATATAQIALKYASPLSTLQPLPEQARRLGSRSLEARAFLLRALSVLDENAEEADLNSAVNAALAVHDDSTAAEAWTRLAFHSGFHLGKHDDSRMFESFARAAIERLGGDEAREAELDYVRGSALLAEGRPEDAAVLLARARVLYEKSRGPDFWRIPAVEMMAGGVDEAMGKLDGALVHERRAREQAGRLFGPESRIYDYTSMNEGEILARLGRGEESAAIFAGVEDKRRKRGETPDAWSEEQHAFGLRVAGRFEEALVHDQHALAQTQAENASGFREAYAPLGAGLDLLGLGRAPEALPYLEKALSVRERGAPPEELAEARFALARALRTAARQQRRARELALGARELYEPLAQRYGSTFRAAQQEIDRWLRAR